jgi:hypothetical protein
MATEVGICKWVRANDKAADFLEISGFKCLVAGTGFEPMTFGL